MSFGNMIRQSVLALACVLVPLAASAAPVYFGNSGKAGGVVPSNCPDENNAACAAVNARDSFLKAIDVTGEESFSSSALGFISGSSNLLQVFGPGSQLSQAAPDFPYAGALVTAVSGTDGRFNTTPVSSLNPLPQWLETDSKFIITLAEAVGAFGFYGTDFGDFQGTLRVKFIFGYDGDSSTADDLEVSIGTDGDPLYPVSGDNGSLVFFGYASSRLFQRIEFSIDQFVDPETGEVFRDGLGFDDMVIGNLKTTTPPPNPMPEPGSLALAGLALLAAGSARRRRRG